MPDCEPLLPPQVRERPFRLALSGGGFRATLFSLGSLLYLVDSGLNRKVRAIHSVSGASVLNGVVAQAVDFAAAGVREMDEIAIKLLRTITGRGLLRSSWVTPAYLILLAVGVSYLAVEALFSLPLGLAPWQLVAGFALLATAAILRGQLIVRLLAVQFFRQPTGTTRLQDVTHPTHHVFCATDLNSAGPAYFTTGGGDKPALHTQMGRAEVPDFRLDHAVRASAAFPGGIPPKRVSLERVGLTWRQRTHRVPEALKSMSRSRHRPGRVARLRQRLQTRLGLDRGRFLFLADGGVCNNLATDRVAGTAGQVDETVLVVDASAPLDTRKLRHLLLPMFAEVGNIIRSMSVLYANTVEPRIAELETRGALVLRSSEAPAGVDFPIVVRVTDNTSDGVRRLRRMRQRAGISDSAETAEARKKLLRRSRRQWNQAAEYLRQRYDHRVMAARSPDVPTTFGRVEKPKALGLILHGYLSTMIALTHSHQAPNGKVDVGRFERLLRFEPSDDPAFDPEPPAELL